MGCGGGVWVRWVGRRLQKRRTLGTDWLQGNRMIEGKCFLLSGTRVPGGVRDTQGCPDATSGILSPTLLLCGAVLTLQTPSPHSSAGRHTDL